MSIRIRNIEELTEKIDEDIQWRKKEIADIKMLCQKNNNLQVLLRSSFVLCCAHFEGSIRFASNAYIAYISSQNIKGKDLRIEVASIVIRKKKHGEFEATRGKKLKVSTVIEVLKAYEEMLDHDFFIKLNEDDLLPEIDENDLPLPTEGNPNPDVLLEIANILGLDYKELFQLREPFINGELLKPRHAVAHGERFPITIDALNKAVDFVIETMERYKTVIIEAASNNRHMRNMLSRDENMHDVRFIHDRGVLQERR